MLGQSAVLVKTAPEVISLPQDALLSELSCPYGPHGVFRAVYQDRPARP
ncbi:hypothetical protein EIO60_02474|nr:hypothetical protein [Candidatus Pantoea persica]